MLTECISVWSIKSDKYFGVFYKLRHPNLRLSEATQTLIKPRVPFTLKNTIIVSLLDIKHKVGEYPNSNPVNPDYFQ